MKQESALNILQTGKNVFLTGQPGTGKTYTINAYINWLRSQGVEPAITASTGIAATHVGGMTIHSWSGLGIRKALTKSDLQQLKESKTVNRRVRKCSILIIDEISMLDAGVFDNLNLICQTVRDNSRFFGGLQVIVVGDFFQLPPVSRQGEPEARFAYESQAWQSAKFTVCYLSEQYRHEDESLAKILTQIRQAQTPLEEIYQKLSEYFLDDQSQPEFDELTCRLFSHNLDVDRLNQDLLKKIANKEKKFIMSGRGGQVALANLKRSCLSPEDLRLKIGARVMFTKNNYERGVINGQLGEVVEFDEEDGWPVVRLKNGQIKTAYPDEWLVTDGSHTIARVSQVPLRLAWAMTVHKSQGLTLDAAIVDLTQAFAFGQGYVALSRVKSFTGLKIIGLNQRALEVDPGVLVQDQFFQQLSAKLETEIKSISSTELAKRSQEFVLSCGATGKPKTKTTKKAKGATYLETLVLLQANDFSIKAVAKLRSLTAGTIFSHVEELFVKGKLNSEQVNKMIPEELVRSIPKIIRALEELETESLSPVYNFFNSQYTFEDLRMARLVKLALGK